MKESSKCYCEYIIKKVWLRNDHCHLLPEDVELFLDIVTELLTSSRDANRRFMKILRSVSKRHELLDSIRQRDITNKDLTIQSLRNIVNETIGFVKSHGRFNVSVENSWNAFKTNLDMRALHSDIRLDSEGIVSTDSVHTMVSNTSPWKVDV